MALPILVPLTCRLLLLFVAQYVARRLSEPARERFESHLEHCPECVTFLNDAGRIARLARVARRNPQAPPPEDVPAALVRAVKDSLAATDIEPGSET